MLEQTKKGLVREAEKGAGSVRPGGGGLVIKGKGRLQMLIGLRTALGDGNNAAVPVSGRVVQKAESFLQLSPM